MTFEWSSLVRVRLVGHDVPAFRAISDTAIKFSGPYQVSNEQARPIMSDPQCSEVELSNDQRRLTFAN